jgi:hypothetical protein
VDSALLVEQESIIARILDKMRLQHLYFKIFRFVFFLSIILQICQLKEKRLNAKQLRGKLLNVRQLRGKQLRGSQLSAGRPKEKPPSVRRLNAKQLGGRRRLRERDRRLK